MSIELNTPLADALGSAIQPKLEEFGWATGGADDNALAEYIILMLVNGKTQDEVATELAGDLLALEPEDPNAREFSRWLFDTIGSLTAQFGSSVAQATDGEGMAVVSQDDSTFADADQDTDMSIANETSGEINAPTGPKAMRDGTNGRGGRGKRILGQLNRAMDRTQDQGVLHRIRGAAGTERINSHSRAPPTGPRMGNGRQPRVPNNRAASIAHGLSMGGPMLPNPAGMNVAIGPMGMNGAWGMMPGQQQQQQQQQPPPQQVDIMQRMLEAQAQMLAEMQQQMLVQQAGGPSNGSFNGQGRGKSLFERTQHPNQRGNFRGRGGHHHQNGHHNGSHPSSHHSSEGPRSQGEDADMAGVKNEALSPEDRVCKYNLRCTNKDCKSAHQSPVAPPGTTVDMTDVCTYGAACKNRKCVGRHPSPATKVAHQSEQDCKFWPNCQNPRCIFKHPSKPPCRNGGDCKIEGCEFTHTQVMCKFRPCTNRYCTFKHEDGQRGTFGDKVWVAGEGKEHPSERKFADDKATEEVVLPGSGGDDMVPEPSTGQMMEG